MFGARVFAQKAWPCIRGKRSLVAACLGLSRYRFGPGKASQEEVGDMPRGVL